nr:uncharacterized protein LOC111421277 [Onthophagus taurus]
MYKSGFKIVITICFVLFVTAVFGDDELAFNNPYIGDVKPIKLPKKSSSGQFIPLPPLPDNAIERKLLMDVNDQSLQYIRFRRSKFSGNMENENGNRVYSDNTWKKVLRPNLY